jgi:hypothetical protein
VKLSEVEALRGMLAAPNALIMTGGAVALRVAREMLLTPPLVELACTLLFLIPPVVAVTFTEKLHELLVGSVAPARLTEDDPAGAVMVPAPQVPASALGVETTKPAGRLSVKATPLSGPEFAAGLLSVKVSEVEPPTATLATPNDFVIVGGVATVRFADAVFPVPPLLALTAPVVLV